MRSCPEASYEAYRCLFSGVLRRIKQVINPFHFSGHEHMIPGSVSHHLNAKSCEMYSLFTVQS